jgi:hypothetical protein
MDQDKSQTSRELDADTQAQGDRSVKPDAQDAASRDYSTKAGNPDVKVKNIQDDTEFISRRGPLGSGD